VRRRIAAKLDQPTKFELIMNLKNAEVSASPFRKRY
jgi:hypothetical protein